MMMGETTESKCEVSAPTSDVRESYMRALSDPLLDSFELLSCNDDDVVMEYRNFEPARLIELLINRALTHKTPPEQFHTEIRTIISSRFLANWLVRDPEEEEWYKTLLKLESKYEVKETGNEPDSLTFSRLCCMFPHFSVVCARNPKRYKTGLQVSAPIMMAEFGGLIPRGRVLEESVRDALIIVHLYVARDETTFPFPLRTHQILLRHQIQSGLLSDERRVRILVNEGLITPQGELSSQMTKAFEYIKTGTYSEFMSRIDRRLF